MEHLTDSIALKGIYPLAISTGSEYSDTNVSQNIIDNEALLKMWWFIEEGGHHIVDENNELAHEMNRIEAKLDMLLALISSWIGMQTRLPEKYNLELSSSHLTWQEKNPQANEFTVGTVCQADCYIVPGHPLPLKLSGQISTITQVGQGLQIKMELVNMDDKVAQLLEKILFRYHRRQVASSKHSSRK
ncbi:MAG: PilZ domain-containing protein [Gammaproteobacteria bacterium]|nr:PilZ domain-containing protein [Gammaproteobacteria bacterium]